MKEYEYSSHFSFYFHREMFRTKSGHTEASPLKKKTNVGPTASFILLTRKMQNDGISVSSPDGGEEVARLFGIVTSLKFTPGENLGIITSLVDDVSLNDHAPHIIIVKYFQLLSFQIQGSSGCACRQGTATERPILILLLTF